ncbi:unnamed protein product [Rhizoctonia solani]|uniref:Uncharacterized protein n=1 Tax=Rhizoctonia solani TaxID=456999 RepID=A0A8H3HDT7_9AGAM|nr:unnamed protein product [Rhizoctonia solani]
MRKKCDEDRPFCSRCTRTGSRCIWPGQSEQDTDSRSSDSAFNGTNIGDLFLSFPNSSGSVEAVALSFESSTNHPAPQQLDGSFVHGNSGSEFCEPHTRSSWRHSMGSDMAPNSLKPVLPSWSVAHQSTLTCPTDASTSTGSSRALTHSRALEIRMWEYSQDFGPRIIWPNHTTDDNDDYDPEGVMPLIRRSLATLRISGEPNFQEMLTFYSIFLTRYVSDYALVGNILLDRARRRFSTSDSLKHGMVATALLFRANYGAPPLSTDSLRSRSKEQYQLGLRALRLELESDYLSSWVKIAGLVELMNYEYIAGYLSAYYHHLSQAATLVRAVMGSGAIDFTNLSGEQTFDIRLVAWYDILSSMALARPTLLDYDLGNRDLSSLPRLDETLDPDCGVEWIVGYPDILLVFVARISNLRHARLSPEERTIRAAEIEQLVRNIQFHPVKAESSTLRVARLGVQEACRHAVILYIYHAIFRSDSSHPIVRDSVKTIIKIASTLKPGVNPDCFIAVPYFIAGTFAESQRDRLILRNRVLSCGNERYLRDLAAALDDLWKETDATGRLADWSGKRPPKFVF